MASESQSSAAADTAVAAADVKQSSWVSFFKEAGLDEFPSSTQAAMMKQLDDEMFSPTPRILSELKANPALLNSFGWRVGPRCLFERHVAKTLGGSTLPSREERTIFSLRERVPEKDLVPIIMDSKLRVPF
jgi:hypothetical protein